MGPVQITELNHAVLYVRDVGTAVGFYRDVLLPEDEWGEYATRSVVAPLDLESEVARRS